jgi:hypothetical protein
MYYYYYYYHSSFIYLNMASWFSKILSLFSESSNTLMDTRYCLCYKREYFKFIRTVFAMAARLENSSVLPLFLCMCNTNTCKNIFLLSRCSYSEV